MASSLEVLNLVLQGPLVELAPGTGDPSRCPNCDQPTANPRSPYCGNACREEASFVRQLRSQLASGKPTLQDEGGMGEEATTIGEPHSSEGGGQGGGGNQLGSGLSDERVEGLAQALWHLLGGGYPERIKLVPERVRAQVIARHGGKCQLCDAPATDIDHSRTACNRPINLHPTCPDCRIWRPYLDPELVSKAEPKLAHLRTRIHSPTPLRLCDGAEEWDWRDFLKRRKSEH